MTHAICINEVERFNQVKENYNGNLPTILKELAYPLLDVNENKFSMKQLDYGSQAVSLTKQQIIDALQYNLDGDKYLPWQVSYCKEVMVFIQNHKDDYFMYVIYEI